MSSNELLKIITDIRLQLKLPIGYEGRSYDHAVRDFDGLLRRAEGVLIQYDRDSEELKSLLKDVAEIADKSREKIREALAL